MTRQADHGIALRLSRTWDAFFSRFGRLTEVQRRAIPTILDGKDALVCAPTASGKTEAVCAPLIERQVMGDGGGMLLYISPTRALVNDLFERLDSSCRQLGLKAVRRTGDHSALPAAAIHVLITTPESFDSLLCRQRRPDGHLLADVTAVALDEVHLLHGTNRGEQLRWLLQRLRRLKGHAKEHGWTQKEKLQVCALSATVDDPAGICSAYLSDGARIEVKGGRDIQEVQPPGDSPAASEAIPAYVKALTKPEKILVFSNTRKRVDALSHDMRKPLEAMGYEVHAHHGSLSREVREEAEARAKACDKLALFATSTLEIGVDIGDIDLVVLDGPAHDVRSLLQRIGRGNRRTSVTKVMPCSGSVAETVLHAAMLQDARAGYLAESERGPQLAVARQQLVSYIYQRKERIRSRAGLGSLVESMLPGQSGTELIDHLLSTDELSEVPDGIRLGQEWLDAAAAGEIHSNIESDPGQSVVEQTSGKELAGGVRYKDGAAMRIGGHMLTVKNASSARIAVEMSQLQGLPEGRWNYVTGAWLQGAGQADALRRFLGIDEGVWPVVQVSKERTAVFHFGGGRREAVLELLALGGADGLAGVDGWALYFSTPNPTKLDAFANARPSTVALQVPKRLASLEKELARPRANAKLPFNWRVKEVAGWLDAEHECASAATAVWSIASPQTRDVLHVFAEALLHKRRGVGFGTR